MFEIAHGVEKMSPPADASFKTSHSFDIVGIGMTRADDDALLAQFCNCVQRARQFGCQGDNPDVWRNRIARQLFGRYCCANEVRVVGTLFEHVEKGTFEMKAKNLCAATMANRLFGDL